MPLLVHTFSVNGYTVYMHVAKMIAEGKGRPFQLKGTPFSGQVPDRTFKLTSITNLRKKKIVTFMWYANDMFHYMFKAELVTLVSLKVPSGTRKI